MFIVTGLETRHDPASAKLPLSALLALAMTGFTVIAGGGFFGGILLSRAEAASLPQGMIV